MAQEYRTPEWKQWSTVYCNRCWKALAHFKGWYREGTSPIQTEVYCKKCSQEIQREQQRLTEVAQK